MTDREALNMPPTASKQGEPAAVLRAGSAESCAASRRRGRLLELLIAVLEDAAAKQDIDNMRIYKDTELVAKLEESRE